MFKNSPIITVVIPNFNDKDYIQEAINSVLNQTFQNFEVLIVDDGSNVETKRVLNKLQSDRIRLITQKNKGLSAARNTGFKAAKGEYVLTIDADDTVEATFLEKAISILENNPLYGAVSCHCKVFIKKNKVISEHKPKGGYVNDFLFDNNSVSFALIRKKTWEEVGGYDEKMLKGFEDWEFWISITKIGWIVGMIPELLFNYRQKETSMSKHSKEYHRETNLNYIFKKHEDIYKNHFPEIVDFLTNLAQRHKRNEIKYKTSIEFKIGSLVLLPLRKIKHFFK